MKGDGRMMIVIFFNKNITDFAGRQVVEEKSNYVLQDHDLEIELQKYMRSSDGQENVNPNMIGFPRPVVSDY